MRPAKFKNLGNMRKLNCPHILHSDLERLLTVLDELAVHVDPCEELSNLSDNLEDKLSYIEER